MLSANAMLTVTWGMLGVIFASIFGNNANTYETKPYEKSAIVQETGYSPLEEIRNINFLLSNSIIGISNLSNGTKSEIKEETKENTKEWDLLFVGDSRFVGMRNANTKGYTFICETGMGYHWYLQQSNYIDDCMDENTIMVFGLGVNDVYSPEIYEDLVCSKYFSRMFFVSVNPVDEQKETQYGYSITNQQIDIFNKRMKELFGDRYIDTNTFLKENGFNTVDGLHYDNETYEKIYEKILTSFN